MNFAALALDYDGTIAVDGRFHPAVRQAIGEARRRGISVILVTGRRLSELCDVAEDLTCFDAVVGENGAVLEFPSSGRLIKLGRPANPAVVREIERRGVEINVGESVIEAEAGTASQILEVVHRLEQPLVIIFNRDRLMVLPQGISKSTGLHEALFALRLSIHNTVGIGDAENDHDLLDACEVGAAVSWGSRALRAAADDVIEGSGPEAVAEYIRALSQHRRLSPRQMGRRRVLLGHEQDGKAVELALRGRPIVIAGEPRTGKSWLAGSICEQLILQGYCLCIVDPEGEYRSLETLPNVIVRGGHEAPPRAPEVVGAFRYPDVSVILDLSKLSTEAKSQYLDTLLPLLAALRQRTGLPHRILVDQAHRFLSDAAGRVVSELAGGVLVTDRIPGIDTGSRATGDAVVLITHEGYTAETGSTRFRLAPRLTAHLRRTPEETSARD
jgi:hydroxymethylpyrimidine pyrophosphatase-like HAD family hydrolase